MNYLYQPFAYVGSAVSLSEYSCKGRQSTCVGLIYIQSALAANAV